MTISLWRVVISGYLSRFILLYREFGLDLHPGKNNRG
nr:MAG TPA: hypothetical protein [Caudoviricetes sp.]